MKKIILTLIIIYCSLVIGECQWVQIPGIVSHDFGKIVNNDTFIFIGGNNLYRSENGGLNWNTIYTPGFPGINALNFINNNLLFSNGYNNFYSTNNGINWISIQLNEYPYWFILFNNIIFAGCESHGCWTSTNNGLNWIQSGFENDDILTFLIVNDKLFAGASSGLYYTTNNGNNWFSSIPGFQTWALIKTSSKIFAGGSLGIYYSTNNGSNWNLSQINNTGILSLFSTGQIVFAGAFSNGIYVSTDNGSNWIQKNEGLPNSPSVNSITVYNNIVFISTTNQGVWKRNLSEMISGIFSIGNLIPEKFMLHQNYPNPFNAVTKIRFDVSGHPPYPLYLSRQASKGEVVTLKVFDIIGREIQTLVNEQLQPGMYEVMFDGSGLASGIYFYQLRSGEFVETKKLVLLK